MGAMESESQPPEGAEAPPPSPPQAPPPSLQAPPYDPLAEDDAPPSGWEGRPLASWGSRVGATLIDWLILIVPVAVVIALVVLVAFSSGVGAVALGVFSGAAYLVGVVLYAPVLMARSGSANGATWGKQIVGIRAVRDVGQPFDFGSALMREFVIKGLLFGTVGGWFLGIPTLLDYLWPLWDDENRCLHDMVAKTHVIRG